MELALGVKKEYPTGSEVVNRKSSREYKLTGSGRLLLLLLILLHVMGVYFDENM
jgi:hypothetical protein